MVIKIFIDTYLIWMIGMFWISYIFKYLFCFKNSLIVKFIDLSKDQIDFHPYFFAILQSRTFLGVPSRNLSLLNLILCFII